MRSIIAVLFALTIPLLGGCGNEEGKVSNAKKKKPPIIKNKANWLVSYSEAVEKSKATNKPIFAFFTGSDWCKYCSLLDNQVLSTPLFNQWAKENVILLQLDFPRREAIAPELKKQNEALLGRYRVSGFPTILFLTDEGVPFLKAGYEDGGAEYWINAVDKRFKESLKKLESNPPEK